MALQRLKDAAEKAKCDLSTLNSTEINLPFIANDANGARHLNVTLDRETLEGLVGDVVEQTMKSVEQCVTDAGLGPKDIDHVVLVGGQTRTPMVQSAVTEFFGKRAHRGVNPTRWSRSARRSRAACWSPTSRDLLLLDVTPLSLGIATFDGHFATLIERNTTVPVQKSHVFTTTRDKQTRGQDPRAPGRERQGGREPPARRVRALERPAGAEGRARDRGLLRHRRQRDRERLGARQRHRRRTVDHREHDGHALGRGDRAHHARPRAARAAAKEVTNVGGAQGSKAGARRDQSVSTLLRDAQTLVRGEDFEGALDLYQTAASLEPERIELEGSKSALSMPTSTAPRTPPPPRTNAVRMAGLHLHGVCHLGPDPCRGTVLGPERHDRHRPEHQGGDGERQLPPGLAGEQEGHHQEDHVEPAVGDPEVARDVGTDLPRAATFGKCVRRDQVAVVQWQTHQAQDDQQDPDDPGHDAIAEEGGVHGFEGTWSGVASSPLVPAPVRSRAAVRSAARSAPRRR